MRTAAIASTFGARALVLLTCLALASALPLAAAKSPQPVSPGATARGTAVEARCPTFQWAGVSGARGYELAVFRFSEDDGAEPRLVSRASVPGDARGFTLSSGDCLERGGRYAWSIAAAAPQGELEWSAPYLFEVHAAPSLEELERAIATIERYREHGLAAEAATGPADRAQQPAADSPSRQVSARSPRTAPLADDRLPGALTSPTSGVTRITSAAAPTLGTPSLSVSANIALSAASNVFKNGVPFLWDDDTGNTALGRNALASATEDAVANTAVGRFALQNTSGSDELGEEAFGDFNTAVGYRALANNTQGYGNTATGFRALRYNDIGKRNTAIGSGALFWNTSGSDSTAVGFGAITGQTTGASNTAAGYRALEDLTTGQRNTAIGYLAGDDAVSGDDNLFLGTRSKAAAAGESNTIRIGGKLLNGNPAQTRAFISGIFGVTTGSATTSAVLVDSNGQLGTAAASSLEVKQDVQGLGTLADRLLELRPVAFRYKQHVATDPDGPLQFGLVAEEVAEVFPELVVYGQDGKPQGVKYHLLSSLLLGELQKQHDELSEQRSLAAQQETELERQHHELARLAARLEAIEAGQDTDAVETSTASGDASQVVRGRSEE